MKLLAFSDVHTDLAACRRLVTLAQNSDIEVVVGAGDFATMRQGLQPVIDVIAEITQPVVLVPGNGESWEELSEACRSYPDLHVLHGSGVELAGDTFFGLGYAVPTTPFGAWSCDLTEEQAVELLLDCPDGALLVSHSPPLGHVDTNQQGRHIGSRAVLETIHRGHPRLVLCGHVHDCWQQSSQVGTTTIYNLGPMGRIIDAPAATERG